MSIHCNKMASFNQKLGIKVSGFATGIVTVYCHHLIIFTLHRCTRISMENSRPVYIIAWRYALLSDVICTKGRRDYFRFRRKHCQVSLSKLLLRGINLNSSSARVWALFEVGGPFKEVYRGWI